MFFCSFYLKSVLLSDIPHPAVLPFLQDIVLVGNHLVSYIQYHISSDHPRRVCDMMISEVIEVVSHLNLHLLIEATQQLHEVALQRRTDPATHAVQNTLSHGVKWMLVQKILVNHFHPLCHLSHR